MDISSLLELFNNLEKETKIVLKTIISNGKLSQADIRRKSNLTRAKVSDGIRDLEACLIINHRIAGRSNKYWLTEYGRLLVNALRSRGKSGEWIIKEEKDDREE